MTLPVEEIEYRKTHPIPVCKTCEKELLTPLCRGEPIYCYLHCKKHEWQSGYDWPTECKYCGIDYSSYLEDVLERSKIKYDKKDW
jgi:hypothetical protein